MTTFNCRFAFLVCNNARKLEFSILLLFLMDSSAPTVIAPSLTSLLTAKYMYLLLPIVYVCIYLILEDCLRSRIDHSRSRPYQDYAILVYFIANEEHFCQQHDFTVLLIVERF